MADRRTDDTPLAPRRPLAGPGQGQNQAKSPAQSQSQPSSPAPSSAPSSANNQASSQARSNEPVRKPVAERLSDKVSGAVNSATETVRSAAEARRTEKPTATKQRPATPAASRPPSSTGRVRKARLRMTHVDPWSVMKTAFLLAIALGVVTVIAVAVVWSVLGAAGVWDSINKTVQEVIGGESGSAFDVENYVGTSRVLGFTMIVAVVDVVLITAIATLGAFLYNLAASLLGGIEVTLAEDEH